MSKNRPINAVASRRNVLLDFRQRTTYEVKACAEIPIIFTQPVAHCVDVAGQFRASAKSFLRIC
jgi:hypothetical protein